MKKYTRWCYKCAENTAHECVVDRFGNYREICAVCNWTNRWETEDGRLDVIESLVVPCMGATLRRPPDRPAAIWKTGGKRE